MFANVGRANCVGDLFGAELEGCPQPAGCAPPARLPSALAHLSVTILLGPFPILAEMKRVMNSACRIHVDLIFICAKTKRVMYRWWQVVVGDIMLMKNTTIRGTKYIIQDYVIQDNWVSNCKVFYLFSFKYSHRFLLWTVLKLPDFTTMIWICKWKTTKTTIKTITYICPLMQIKKIGVHIFLLHL